MTARSLLERRDTASERVAEYTDPAGRYAFTTYDNLYKRGNSSLEPSDVLMANLLSLRLGWRDVIPLFAKGDGDAQHLRRALQSALIDLKTADAFEDYDSLDALEEAVASLAAANLAGAAVPGWTAVTVSKVLHRRRPHIVPILDSRLREFYGVRKPEMLRAALWNDIRDNLDWLRPLAAERSTPDHRPLTVLRLADILMWMD